MHDPAIQPNADSLRNMQAPRQTIRFDQYTNIMKIMISDEV